MSASRRLTVIEMADAIELDDVLKRIAFGRSQIYLMFTCCLIIMFNVNETMGMSIIAPAARCDFEATVLQIIFLHCSAFFGIVLLTYFWGHLCDLLGRRRVLIYTLSGSVCSSLLSMLMPNYGTFLFFRILLGMFIGGPSAITVTYLSEFCTNQNRLHIVYSLSMAQGLAMIYCPAWATYIMEADWYLPMLGPLEYRPWRLLGLLFTLPGILGLCCLCTLPESPKFLLSISDEKRAFATLAWIYRHNQKGELVEAELNQLRQILLKDDTRRQSWHARFLCRMCGELRVLCRPPYVFNFVLTFAIFFGLVFVANGMGIWFTEMRNHMVADSAPSTVCVKMAISQENDIEPSAFICIDTFKSFLEAITLGMTFIVTFYILSGTLFIVSRKIVFIVPLIVSSISGICLNWVVHPLAISVLFMLFLAMPGVVVNLLGSAVVDFVPTNLRGKTMCLCFVFGRLGILVGNTILGELLNNYMCVYAFNLFACIPLVCSFLAIFLPM